VTGIDIEQLKHRVCAAVDERAEKLRAAARELHAHPELGFDEHHAHDVLTDLLEGDGLEVDRGAFGLPTAFRSRAGETGPSVAVLCEYDALPGIGHACGHNVIGTAGVGAGLAAAAVASRAGGRVVILGTPAEEGGGGKQLMVDKGALEGVDAAMMIHPADADLTRMDTIAVHQLEVTYHGRASHAAAAPHLGRNALDAAVLGYLNVAALRQHIEPGERVHGIFTEAGTAANVVPERAAAHWFVRSPLVATLHPLKERVLACLQAGADAAGCTMEHRWIYPPYDDMVDNPPMVDCYVANAARLGRTVVDPSGAARVVGSTDMGNVSHLVPSIHPMIGVAPSGVSIHTEEFATWTGSERADAAVLDGAKAMAMTIVDLWCRPDVLAAARSSFGDSVN
jgi:amidohydrolase